jgi:hypothetical protein
MAVIWKQYDNMYLQQCLYVQGLSSQGVLGYDAI